LNRRLPPDQSVRDQAVQLGRDVFLAAGAGTGKTTVLVGRYMAALEAGIRPHEIVAVTYTVKAAAEMRQRLREKCAESVAAGNPEEARRWRQTANELETAPISTIHGFCGSLLRDFAVEAGLDPHYSIIEERATWLLRRGIVRQTLLQRLTDGEESAVAVVAEYGRRNAEDLLDGILQGREHHVRRLEAPPSVEDLLAYWNQIRPMLVDECLRDVLDSGKVRAALNILETHPPHVASAKFAAERQAVMAEIERARSEADAMRRIAAARAAQAAAAVHKRGGRADDWGAEETFKAVKDALNVVKKQLGDFYGELDELEEADFSLAAENTVAFWREAAACSDAFQAAKAAQSLLDFTDLQLQIARLLQENAEVRKRCRQRYKQVMVDEFQDTNDLQRQIIWAVTGFDSQNAEREGPRLFVVGDAKQSIYGFRNADVAVFRRVRVDFRGGCDGVDELLLKASFRSTDSLTCFHNWLFSHDAVMGTGDKPDYAAQFEPVETQRAAREDGLAGEVLITNVRTGENADDEFSAERRREAEAANLAARLREMLDRGFTVTGEDGEPRPLAGKDIAILFRATTNINLYERALRRHGIDFHTVVGRGFWYRPEVSDLLNMIRVLDNFGDAIALAGVLRSPLFGFDDNELYRAAKAADTLYAGLCRQGEGEDGAERSMGVVEKAWWAWRKLQEFRSQSAALPLSVLLSRIVDETGYSAAMAAQFGGQRRVANIEKLIDVARGFEREGSYSLRDFVSYVETLREMDDREGEAPPEQTEGGAVQLLTVHQAKGLEWPVVVIPDFGRGPRSGGEALVTSTVYGICARVAEEDGGSTQCAIGRLIRQAEAHRQQAEEQRLLYVAATRARDYLIISAGVDPDKSGPHSGMCGWFGCLAEAAGWDAASIECDELGDGPWRMAVTVAPPGELPPMQAAGQSLAQRHKAAFLSGTPVGEYAVGVATRRRVAAIPVMTTDFARMPVTALAQYRRCPFSYCQRFVRDMPELDAGWGLGRLEEGASGVTVGTFAHLVLELIGREGVGAIDQALADAQSSPAVGGPLAQRQVEEVRKWLETYLNTTTYDRIIGTAKYLRSEVPAAFVLDGVMIEGKIDALAQTTEGCMHVLDYKTGRPEDAEQLGYEFQMGLYCEAVRRVHGQLPVSATLIHLSAGVTNELPVADVVEQSLSEAKQIIHAIRAGQFGHRCGPPCQYCGYGLMCEYRCG